MKTNYKNNTNENIMEIACADIRMKKIYVTSGTMKRGLVFGSDAAALINQFRTQYPTFKVEVNDAFFLRNLRVVPA